MVLLAFPVLGYPEKAKGQTTFLCDVRGSHDSMHRLNYRLPLYSPTEFHLSADERCKNALTEYSFIWGTSLFCVLSSTLTLRFLSAIAYSAALIHYSYLTWGLYMTEDRFPEVLYLKNTPLVSS